MSERSNKWKFILPPILLALGVVATALILKARPAVETVEEPPPLQLVRVMRAEPQTVRLDVTSQGTVLPRTETVLIPEVAAKIEALSPNFAAGGFFERGEVLLRLDAREYSLAITQARAQVAQAEVALVREQAEAEIAVEEWQELGRPAGAEEAPPLVRREPQLAQARAAVESAKAALARAELNQERTVLRAPFAGRVRTKTADVGQYVTPGQPLGQVYAIDYVEVRLPVPDDQLAYLDLPMAYRGRSSSDGPEVFLTADFAGQRHRWQGRIVRTEGEIDARSRMVHLVARVDDPYARGRDLDRPPLAVGMFVQARIEGRRAEDVVVLPRVALRGKAEDGSARSQRVLVLTEGQGGEGESRGALRFRTVELLRTTGDLAFLSGGLTAGERVCISALETTIEGMAVRSVDEPPLRLDEVPREEQR